MKKEKTVQPSSVSPAIAKQVLAAVPGKNPDRVPAYYQKYPEDWNAQYNMLLPDDVTCSSCVHCLRCCTIFGQKETDTACQFYPSRFRPSANGG